MKAFLFVGQTGTGKSTLAKKVISQITKGNSGSVMVYDINNEHGNEGYNTFDPREFKINEFLQIVKNNTKKVVFIDEATIFFSSRSYSPILTELLTLKRHSQNVYILIFHSIRKIPPEIMDLCNYIYLLPTNDRLDLVEKKFESFPELVEAFRDKKPQQFKPFFYELI